MARTLGRVEAKAGQNARFRIPRSIAPVRHGALVMRSNKRDVNLANHLVDIRANDSGRY